MSEQKQKRLCVRFPHSKLLITDTTPFSIRQSRAPCIVEEKQSKGFSGGIFFRKISIIFKAGKIKCSVFNQLLRADTISTAFFVVSSDKFF